MAGKTASGEEQRLSEELTPASSRVVVVGRVSLASEATRSNTGGGSDSAGGDDVNTDFRCPAAVWWINLGSGGFIGVIVKVAMGEEREENSLIKRRHRLSSFGRFGKWHKEDLIEDQPHAPQCQS